MKSGKQRRAELLTARAERAAKAQARKPEDPRRAPSVSAPCNAALLAPYNSYGMPPFVERGHYLDLAFECRDCGKQELWRATQQKWWYEVAKGDVESRATRCSACRRLERERRDEARRVHQQGLAARRR